MRVRSTRVVDLSVRPRIQKPAPICFTTAACQIAVLQIAVKRSSSYAELF